MKFSRCSRNRPDDSKTLSVKSAPLLLVEPLCKKRASPRASKVSFSLSSGLSNRAGPVWASALLASATAQTIERKKASLRIAGDYAPRGRDGQVPKRGDCQHPPREEAQRSQRTPVRLTAPLAGRA